MALCLLPASVHHPLQTLVCGLVDALLQPHTQLLCVTTRVQGSVLVTTGAGSSGVLQYSSAELLLPPIVVSVTPLLWDTSAPTAIVIEGERYVRACMSNQRGAAAWNWQAPYR